MNRILLFISFVSLSLSICAQEKIDGAFPFDTDPNKLYSLYIPSGYDASEAHALMLGLHPFNTARWDAEAWRDTLTVFAEANNLILVCPDGGLDGKVDSPIDTAFTSALLDSMALWYNIDSEKQYVMGFSWGAKTSYTYGLRNSEKFKGFLVIGAAVNIAEVDGIIENAKDETFFLVHGSNDTPNTRFTPLLNALEDNNACVNSNLLSGVGHTIDFPNRNNILTEAFQWILDSSCNSTAISEAEAEVNLEVYPNPAQDYIDIKVDFSNSFEVNIYDSIGNRVLTEKNNARISINALSGGTYLLEYQNHTKNKIATKKLIINR